MSQVCKNILLSCILIDVSLNQIIKSSQADALAEWYLLGNL